MFSLKSTQFLTADADVGIFIYSGELQLQYKQLPYISEACQITRRVEIENVKFKVQINNIITSCRCRWSNSVRNILQLFDIYALPKFPRLQDTCISFDYGIYP